MLLLDVLDLKQGTELENPNLPDFIYEFIYFDHVKNIGFVRYGYSVKRVDQKFLMKLSIIK